MQKHNFTVGSAMSELLYPGKCVVCHRLLSDTGQLCEDCRRALHPITEPRCKRCSKPVQDPEAELCGDCRGRDFCVERGFALYLYDDKMQRAVRNLKYRGELAGGRWFGHEMAGHYGRWIRGISPEVLIPVPIHKKRMRFRGFNQAAVLAEEIGGELGIPVDSDYLLRIENTKPQKGLGNRARLQNLRKGIRVRGDHVRTYHTVLLVDDIYTTGATLEACGRALREVGTNRIYFLCLCIGRGD